ncbi:MAG: hypothetical protein A2V66_06085 [Ignavibacteria bacterium RBG_13_36_8]|nr:MAG: hypothetical protein A2V66_06085 [Ignavibacteria bacterium RBG_13_36_8]
MGGIIFWTIIRVAFLIPALWLLLDWTDFKFWWAILAISLYGVVIHPAVVQYKLFVEQNKEIFNNSLCATCRHFDGSAVICMKYDKHPTIHKLPCEGIAWEPIEK